VPCGASTSTSTFTLLVGRGTFLSIPRPSPTQLVSAGAGARDADTIGHPARSGTPHEPRERKRERFTVHVFQPVLQLGFHVLSRPCHPKTARVIVAKAGGRNAAIPYSTSIAIAIPIATPMPMPIPVTVSTSIPRGSAARVSPYLGYPTKNALLLDERHEWVESPSFAKFVSTAPRMTNSLPPGIR
jgi:hypothetical protein